MGEPEYIHIAATMLDIDPNNMSTTHPELYKKLGRIDALCKKVKNSFRDAGLVSRQVIGTIVDDWQVQQSNNPG